MPDPIVVHHALGRYPVYVEPGIVQRLDTMVAEHLPHRRVTMVADATVHQLYHAGRFGPVAWTGEALTIPPGEKSKSRESWARLSDELLHRGLGRDSGLLGLGGGVVGDLTGFVAATYMRGIPYLLIPTTLLAMVDASVGGKTGVNTTQGKNLIGAFHPPVAVVADPLTLLTLPEREYRSGLAEAVKHGWIADRDYFEWIHSRVGAISRRDPETVTELIRRSVMIKADVVSRDEREAGRRAILNAGHTVGHALEQTSNYELAHGEAVSLGLLAECRIAERLGVASGELRPRLQDALTGLGLPGCLPYPLDRERVLSCMARDKKNRSSAIHFVLPSGIGQVHSGHGWTTPVPIELIQEALTLLS